MDICYDEQHSMEVFHDNVNVQILTDICLKYYNTFVFDDIIGSITFKNKNLAKKFLDEAEMKYVSQVYESGESSGEISLMDLFNNNDLVIDGITSNLTIPDLIFAA